MGSPLRTLSITEADLDVATSTFVTVGVVPLLVYSIWTHTDDDGNVVTLYDNASEASGTKVWEAGLGDGSTTGQQASAQFPGGIPFANGLTIAYTAGQAGTTTIVYST